MARLCVCFLSLLTVFFVALSDEAEAGAKGARFLGSKACRDCHKKIYESWESSRHAKVYDLLKPGARGKEKKEAGLKPDVDYRADKSCVGCHITGSVDGMKPVVTKEMEGVGCEDCHGPAENWLELHSKKDLKKRKRKLRHAGMIQPFRGKTVCSLCHDNINNPYKFRNSGVKDWTDPKLADTYHFLR